MLVFRGLTLWLLGGMNIGPFPAEFQKLSTGFLPDLFDMGGLHSTSIILTVAIPALLVFLSWRSRKLNESHGIEVEPFAFFIATNAVLVAVMLYLGYQLSTYKGFPNILVIMGVLIAFYTFVTTRTTIGRRITRWAAMRRQRGSPASTPIASASTPSSTWAFSPASPA
jgi:multiple monosaccharide ABC transporter membrane protein